MSFLKKTFSTLKEVSSSTLNAPSGKAIKQIDEASALIGRYKASTSDTDRDAALEALQGALSLVPRDRKLRSTLYLNIANVCTLGFTTAIITGEGLGQIGCLDQAIQATRECINLTKENEPDFAERLSALVARLRMRYSATKDQQDLEESITLSRKGLALPDLHTTTRMALQTKLSSSLVESIDAGSPSSLERLDEAISIMRDLVESESNPLSARDVTPSLQKLSRLLGQRGKRLGTISDIDEAISINRNLIQINYPGLGASDREMRATYLQSNAALRGLRWMLNRSATDVHEGISELREALSLHVYDKKKADCLFQLGTQLRWRGVLLKTEADTEEGLECLQESVRLTPLDDPAREARVAAFEKHAKVGSSASAISIDDSGTIKLVVDKSPEEVDMTASSPSPTRSDLQVPGPTSPEESTHTLKLSKAMIPLPDLKTFFQKWQLWQIELAIHFIFSPGYEELLTTIQAEYARLEARRLESFPHAPRGTWQQDFESSMMAMDKSRMASFTDWPGENNEVETAILPLSVLLFLHPHRHSRGPDTLFKDRLHPYPATLEIWESLRSAYKGSAQFRSNFSRHQGDSFRVLDDWWNGAYSDDRDINSFRRQLESFVENPPKFDLQMRWSKVRWKSRSVYHSRCIELFFREIHPFSWEPFCRMGGLAELMSARRFTSQIALKQQFAWACFGQQFKTNSRSLGYPLYFHEARKMGRNAFSEAEKYRDLSEEHPDLAKFLQEDSNDPAYLWDTVERRTIAIDSSRGVPDYICISHTWGRWRIKTDIPISGVPWLVPTNSLYDIRDLPGILESCLRPGERYIWFDLFCIPQDNGPQTAVEVAKQASVFGRSRRCIAWLHDVEGWDGVRGGLRYSALTYLQKSTNDNGIGVGIELSEKEATKVHSDAGCHMELVKSGSLEPCTWFSSLWTLQESVLCPNLQLYSHGMEMLTDGRGDPISLRTLFMLISIDGSDGLTGFSIPVTSTAENSGWQNKLSAPKSVLEFQDLCMTTRLDALIHNMYPANVLLQSSLRQSTKSRAQAIMSALAVTDWFKASNGATANENLILKTFPLEFVQEAAKKLGAAFFYTHGSGPRTVKTGGESFAIHQEADVGSMMPFSEPQYFRGLQTRLKMGGMQDAMLKPIDHESVSGWTILADGSVSMSSAAVLASSRSPPSAGSGIEAGVFVDSNRDPEDALALSSIDTEWPDLHESLRRLAAPKHECVAVVLFEDFGIQHGIILRELNSEGDQRKFVKIGLFGTLNRMKTPTSVKVGWKVV